MLSPSFRRVGWPGIEQEARGGEECMSWYFSDDDDNDDDDNDNDKSSRCNKGLVFEVRILGLL